MGNMQSTTKGNLIFDFDYTLAVIPSSNIQRYEIIRKYCNLSKEQLTTTMQEINSDFGFVDAILNDPKQVIEAYNEILKLNFTLSHYVYILPSLYDTIHKLHKCFNLYVYSGRDTKSLNFAMDKIGLKDLFKEIKGSCIGELHKPNPQILNSLISKYDMHLSDTIYIGEKQVDKDLAYNVRCGFIQAKWYRWCNLLETNVCYNPETIQNNINEELKKIRK